MDAYVSHLNLKTIPTLPGHSCCSIFPSPRRRGRRWQPSALARHCLRCPGPAPSPAFPGDSGSRAGSAALPAPSSRGPPGLGRRGRACIWRESIKSRRETRPPSCLSRRQRLGRGAGTASWSTPTTTPGATTATTVSEGRARPAPPGTEPGRHGAPLPEGAWQGIYGLRAGPGSAGGGAEAAGLALAGAEEAKLVEGGQWQGVFELNKVSFPSVNVN